ADAVAHQGLLRDLSDPSPWWKDGDRQNECLPPYRRPTAVLQKSRSILLEVSRPVCAGRRLLRNPNSYHRSAKWAADGRRGDPTPRWPASQRLRCRPRSLRGRVCVECSSIRCEHFAVHRATESFSRLQRAAGLPWNATTSL